MSNELTTNVLAVEIDSLHDEANYHAGQAVVFAVRCGAKLTEVKANLAYGEFGNWINSGACKVRRSQANRYMSLAVSMPDLISEDYQSTGILPSVQQAIELLNAPTEIQTIVTEQIEGGETVSIAEIKQLKEDAKRLEQSTEEWRDQFLSERKSKREGAAELERLKTETDKQINAALVLERKNNQSVIDSANAEVEQHKRDLATLKYSQESKINQEVRSRLFILDNEIKSKELAITEKENRISELKRTEDRLENTIGTVEQHEQAINSMRSVIDSAFIAVGDLVDDSDYAVNDKIKNDWLKIAKAIDSMLTTIEGIADKCATQQKLT